MSETLSVTLRMPKKHKKMKLKNVKLSSRSLLLTLTAIGMFTLLPPAVSFAQYAPEAAHGPVTVGKLLTHISLRNALGQGRIQNTGFYDKQAMQGFYDALDHKTYWVQGNELIPQADTILGILQNSWTHGLNPDNYHVPELETLFSRESISDKARLELLLTDAVVRYMRDVSGMRIDPDKINQEAEYWQQPADAEDIYNALAGSTDPVEVIKSYEPQGNLYNRLREELVKLSRNENGYDHVLPLDFGSNFFKPREAHAAVKSLRVRLGREHNPAQGPENYYDDELAAAVMKLQKQHGLDADGIIGPQTLDILNNSAEEKKKQIVSNLERLRWLDREKPDRYLLVNVASQILWGVDDGKVALEMPVIVGMPYRKTKSFKTEVTGVRFNPDWNVPLSIKMRDFLPKLKKGGPDYLDYKGIEVIRGYGNNARTLDPYAIDWSNVGWGEMNKLRMVQTPGDHNALGRYRILMPNRYNIYLHDTNHPEYFERSQRTLSSGCIRLSDPEAVAKFVLNKNDNFNDYVMKNILSTVRVTEVEAAAKMPIYIIYQSVWLNDKNELVYGADVYNRDKDLLEVLEAMNGYKLPDKADVKIAAIDNNGMKLASNALNE